jgi:hypothetical protein
MDHTTIDNPVDDEAFYNRFGTTDMKPSDMEKYLMQVVEDIILESDTGHAASFSSREGEIIRTINNYGKRNRRVLFHKYLTRMDFGYSIDMDGMIHQ